MKKILLSMIICLFAGVCYAGDKPKTEEPQKKHPVVRGLTVNRIQARRARIVKRAERKKARIEAKRTKREC